MNSSNPVPEPLTRRENDILLLLSKRLTDREIADQLVLSLNTIKWYVRQIYGKLGVSKRWEAVEKARSLDLLSTGTPFKETAHNLPNLLTSFIGRVKEKYQVINLILEHPLVTITGVGGVGKTRLALHVAQELVDAYSDGVWWVALASIRDPYSVLKEVASVLQVHDLSDQSLLRSLCNSLRAKSMLIIFDNCEHLIDKVAELCSCLLLECPKLHILTTSREILSVDGEVIFHCPTLSLPGYFPAPAAESKLQWAETGDAVRLFIDRGAVASPGFALTEKNAVTISGICQHLDGIPLAIELAASQLRFLSVEQIAACLYEVFHFPVGSKRSVLPQHKTLKATIDWSYQLLSPAGQILLRRLSVFAGGWTLTAAESVAAGDGIDPGEVVNLIGELADKSLIVVEAGEVEETRYHMLETIRQYANERLVEAGENKMVNNQHLTFFFSLAETVSPLDNHQFPNLPNTVRLLKEWGNIRLALKWALETNIELGLRVCTSFIDAATLDLSMELDEWLERLLAAQVEERLKRGNQPDEFEYKFIRGKAILLIGTNRMFWGMKDKAVKALLESKALFEAIGEPGKLFVARIGMHLGSMSISSDPEQSMVYLETSRNYFKMMNEKASLSECDRILAALNLYIGNLDQARQLAEESLWLCREVDKLEIASVDYLGNAELLMGNYARAIEFYHQLFKDCQACGDQVWVSYSLSQEGWVAWVQGDFEWMNRLCEAMIRQGQEVGCTNFFFSAEILLSLMDWARGAYDQANLRAQKALSAYQAEYFSFVVPLVYTLGRVALSTGDYVQAEHYFRQVDDMADGPRWKWRAYSLHVFGLLAAAQSSNRPDMAERAVLLFGAQAKLFYWLPNLLSPFERNEYDCALAKLKRMLSEEAFLDVWNQGQAMSHQQAFALALETTSVEAKIIPATSTG